MDRKVSDIAISEANEWPVPMRMNSYQSSEVNCQSTIYISIAPFSHPLNCQAQQFIQAKLSRAWQVE